MVGSLKREEAEQRRVEEAVALLEEKLDSLRRSPSDQMGSAAREAMLDLRPHLEVALEALEDIEAQRDLTERESSLQHAFKMLLAVKKLP